jgi:outer membrane protein assembly factor BamB
LVFTSDAHGIYALDPVDGAVQWQSGPKTFDKRCVLSPVLAGGKILGTCGSGGGGNYMVAVTPPASGKGKAKVEYTVRKAAPYVPTSVVHDGLLFHVDDKGIATCMEPGTGAVVWMERLDANFFGSPVLIDGKVYVIARTGDVLVFAASREFKLLARTPLGEKAFSTPAVANGNLYLRTFSKLYCIKGIN